MRNGPSSYEFDPIGNREYTDEAGTVRQWQANELNQYTTISNGATQTPVFDADGNLVSYNGWTYTWNGENRLIRATNSLYAIEYAYDHMGRMLAKTRDDVNTTYLWDDYNLIAEIAHSTGSGQTTTNVFVWGLDLSGTLQGAGGVGGLLAEFQLSSLIPQPSRGYAAYDANGNISDYVSTNGTITAHREFDAFGNTISSYGATTNFTHWFSTKPWCEVTGLSEYEYRKYSPELGRFINKDPITEFGFKNITDGKFIHNAVELHKHYLFVNNNSINVIDSLGLQGNITVPPFIPENPSSDLESAVRDWINLCCEECDRSPNELHMVCLVLCSELTQHEFAFLPCLSNCENCKAPSPIPQKKKDKPWWKLW